MEKDFVGENKQDYIWFKCISVKTAGAVQDE